MTAQPLSDKAQNKGLLTPGLGATPSPQYIKPMTNGHVETAPRRKHSLPTAAFKPKSPTPKPKQSRSVLDKPLNVQVRKLPTNDKPTKPDTETTGHKPVKHPQPTPEEILPKKLKIITNNVNPSESISSSNKSSPYWSDWEEYTSGSAAASETYESYLNTKLSNRHGPAEKPEEDEDVNEESQEDSSQNETSQNDTSHDTSISSDQSAPDELPTRTPSTSRHSPGTASSPGDDRTLSTLSGDISILTQRMKSNNTPDSIMDVMVALNLIAHDVEKMHLSVQTINERQSDIQRSMSSMENRVSYVEDQVLEIHDKVEYICNNMRCEVSTADDSSTANVVYKSERNETKL